MLSYMIKFSDHMIWSCDHSMQLPRLAGREADLPIGWCQCQTLQRCSSSSRRWGTKWVWPVGGWGPGSGI